MSRIVLYHKPKNMTRKPITQNTLGYTGTRVIPMPMPVISCAQTSGYSFSRVWVWVAQKNPRAARADPQGHLLVKLLFLLNSKYIISKLTSTSRKVEKVECYAPGWVQDGLM
jgi:hypothetical protein